MNIEDYFNSEKFQVVDIARDLFDDQPGAILIPSFLKQDKLEGLLSEIKSRKEILHRAKDTYGRAEQRFFMHYFGWAETGSDESSDFSLVTEFSNAYDRLTRPLVESASLSQNRVSSTGIHIYWKDKAYGLSPHRDESPAQLISVFCLEGYSPFYVADNYELRNKQTFEAGPGSLLLMRGPRNSDERELTKKGPNYNPELDPRPIHCVGPVESERTAILLRHIDETQRRKE